jgi:hypothetical protein
VAAPRTCRRLLPALAALVCAGVTVGPAAADDVLRVVAGRENENRPIQLAADEVATWSEGGEQVILLRGKVLIEQGVFSIRAERAMFWVDKARQAKTQAYRVQIVTDGGVRVEDGTLRKTASTAITELATRQEVKLRPGGKSVPQPAGNDPFFRRALALRPSPAPPPSNLQLTAASAPATPAQGQAPPTGPAPAQPGAPLPTIQVPQADGSLGPTPVLPPTAAGQPPPVRNLRFQRRTDQPFQFKSFPLATGEKAGLITGGVILSVRDAKGGVLLDIEADRVVIWTHGDTDQLFDGMRSTDGATTKEAEVYLSGNVELRSTGNALPGTPAAQESGERVLRAEQMYYDVQRNVAVAVTADLEFRRPGIVDPLHVKADELIQVGPNKYEAIRAHVFSSRLPSDPGLQVVFAKATIEDTKLERRGFFGQTIADPKTGEPETYIERLVRGEDVQLELEGIPVFYLPVVQGDANDPLGPLHSIGFRQDHILGTQVYTSFNMFNLLNRNPLPNVRWMADFDYLSKRGPAAGTELDYAGKDLFGLPGPYAGMAKLFGMHDTGTDFLGGGRGEFEEHPDWRGRLLLRHNQSALDEFNVQGQLSLISDKNFLEQYYKPEFDTDINNETYLYFRQQKDQWAWTLWAKPHVRDWVTEDVWLPRVDGYLLGQSVIDLFTYNLWASGGYAELRPTSLAPGPWPFEQATDQTNSTGRFDVSQELSLPFYLGPVKVVPYGVLDLTAYSNDLNGDAQGRVYGGGGVRTSMPLSRLYPNVESELFNLNGLYHKVVFGGNYFIARTNEPYTNFAQIDRLNDDATDQALRDIYPRQSSLNPGNGVFLSTSPIFDPQLYAIRRLVDDRVDTRADIDVFQADIRQRWQTKRGYPGQEHVVDYLTLDTSVSFFPEANRDNFGKSFGFLEYDTTWNVGDRTAFTSTGWYDPFDNGARVFTIGALMNRPDRTNFYLGFRSIDPVNSRALITSANYVFSPKYAITASSVYDFALNKSLSNSLTITRVGSDLTMNVGFNYNAILNSFGVTFELIPNVVAVSHRPGSGGLTGGGFH